MSLLLTGRQWSSQFDRGPEPANDVVSQWTTPLPQRAVRYLRNTRGYYTH